MAEDHKNFKILVVDDEERNLKILGAMLKYYGYQYEKALNGKEALVKSREEAPDLILLDIMMPEMDGYEVCRNLKADKETFEIPIIMVTALTDHEAKMKGLEAGASDFLSKPVDQYELMLRTKNLLKIKEYSDFLKKHNQLLEKEVAERTAELKTAQYRLKESYHDALLRLTAAAEYKDEETSAHIKRVGLYCAKMAEALGWEKKDVEIIKYAAPMHDIGKIGIPSEILLKRGSLNNEESALMKNHTLIGKQILCGSSSQYIKMGEEIAYTHHERWDGSGYPEGLKGEDIPVAGRIMNMADQYDALRSERPYKQPLDHEQTCRILIEGDGRTLPSHFDPKIHEIFKEIKEDFRLIFEDRKLN